MPIQAAARVFPTNPIGRLDYSKPDRDNDGGMKNPNNFGVGSDCCDEMMADSVYL